MQTYLSGLVLELVPELEGLLKEGRVGRILKVSKTRDPGVAMVRTSRVRRLRLRLQAQDLRMDVMGWNIDACAYFGVLDVILFECMENVRAHDRRLTRQYPRCALNTQRECEDRDMRFLDSMS